LRSCSESIAQLASALAKAQTELVNPAKTLTGVIDRWGSGNEGQSYRYAPLSAGLDIVRKALCKHELAVIQTTHVDEGSAMVLLTTTLAHGSGEWVSACWPVCRTLDMTNPKLMGAALTYARRYGLFTLVGLAGEDDLDAPPRLTAANTDAPAQNGAAVASTQGVSLEQPELASPLNPSGDPGSQGSPPSSRTRRKRSDAGVPRCPRPSPLPKAVPDELAGISDPDALLRWALDALPRRNELDEEARAALDAAFLARATEIGADPELLIAFDQARPPAKPNGAADPAAPV
jgi:hypothetical protein